MTLAVYDRVWETTTTTGTGSVTLLGAKTGYQSFAVVGNGNTTLYCIASQTLTEWEVGIGTYTASGTTLARNSVISSSNSNSLVNFSTGTKDVFISYPASYAPLGPANPSVQIGMSGINGSAITYMRSDAAPGIDATIAPQWTGGHTWVADTASGLAMMLTAIPLHTATNAIQEQNSPAINLIGYGWNTNTSASEEWDYAIFIRTAGGNPSTSTYVIQARKNGGGLYADKFTLTSAGNGTFAGTLSASNLSGTNTGDNPGVTSVATSGLATGGTITTTGTITVTAASQSDQTTATSTTVAVVPNVQQNHPSAAKFWARMTISGTTLTKQGSYNVSSVTRNGAGDYTYTFTTAFTTAEMTLSQFGSRVSGGGPFLAFGGTNYTLATGSVRFSVSDGTNYTDTWVDVHLTGFGTQ